jgi:hypothetical protein
MYQLKDGIPPPPPNGKRYITVYPFNEMQVGQHFDVPIESLEEQYRVLHRVRMAAYKWAKKNPPARIVCRLDGIGICPDAVRVWRVE